MKPSPDGGNDADIYMPCGTLSQPPNPTHSQCVGTDFNYLCNNRGADESLAEDWEEAAFGLLSNGGADINEVSSGGWPSWWVRAVQIDKFENVCCAALSVAVGTRAECHFTLFSEVGWCSKSSRCTDKGRGDDGEELHYEGV